MPSLTIAARIAEIVTQSEQVLKSTPEPEPAGGLESPHPPTTNTVVSTQAETEVDAITEPEHEISTTFEDAEIDEPADELITEAIETGPQTSVYVPGPKRRPSLTAPWGKSAASPFPETISDDIESEEPEFAQEPNITVEPIDSEPPKLTLGVKPSGPQSELPLDSKPRGRFEGETPNVFEGEDLDLPPFLRKKK